MVNNSEPTTRGNKSAVGRQDEIYMSGRERQGGLCAEKQSILSRAASVKGRVRGEREKIDTFSWKPACQSDPAVGS